MVPSVMSSFMILLAQISVILLIARLVGWVFRKIHQPQVMGEIVAGLLLGPSVLGWLVPAASTTLFPPDGLGALNSLGQIGAVLFMFLVGLRIDLATVFARRRAVAVISYGSIVCPLVLGTALALYLYPKLSVTTVPVTGFALFIAGTASVVGHSTRHTGKPWQQTLETLHNLRALITHTEQLQGITPGQPYRRHLLKVYIRHPEHLSTVDDVLKQEAPVDTQVLYLQGEMCRSDLLLEIEGILASR